jgi:hypothetical protein
VTYLQLSAKKRNLTQEFIMTICRNEACQLTYYIAFYCCIINSYYINIELGTKSCRTQSLCNKKGGLVSSTQDPLLFIYDTQEKNKNKFRAYSPVLSQFEIKQC